MAAHYVYILASKRRGALFVGAAEDLADCVLEHRANLVDGLTSQYAIHRLVYYEICTERGAALLRESELRYLPRGMKMQLIESINPNWRDLFDNLVADRLALA
jgi:putative endonuclease